MPNTQRAGGVADIVRQFAEHNELMNHDAETIVSRLVTAALHFAMYSGEMDGIDGRKVALAAARRGLGSFISDVHATPHDPPPATYTLITVRTNDGLWVSETGYEEVIQ
jgi:hypothetical protein